MPQTRDKKFFKKYLKVLTHSGSYPKVTKELLKTAPTAVLKLIANAALLAAKGNLKIPEKNKALFRKRKKTFQILANRSIPFEKKRQYLVQRGGNFLIPVLLSTVLPLVGDLLFKAFSKT